MQQSEKFQTVLSLIIKPMDQAEHFISAIVPNSQTVNLSITPHTMEAQFNLWAMEK